MNVLGKEVNMVKVVQKPSLSEGVHVNKKSDTVCKGIVARASVSEGFVEYNNGTSGFFHRKRLHILKRKSCPGCEKCGWFYEIAQEVHLEELPLEGFDSVEDQKLYSIWGCGDEDDFHLCVKPYKE